MNSDLRDLLDKVENIVADKISCKLPSTGATIFLEPLTIKQQKDLIKQTVNGVKSIVKYTRTSNIIVANASNNSDLLICDKAPILLELRRNAISNLYKDMDLSIISEKYAAYKRQFSLEETITYKNMNILCWIPTINYDNILLSSVESLIKDDEKRTSENLDVVYTYELARFVKSIEIDGTAIDFTQLTSFKDRSLIFEKLPLSVNKMIIEFIEKYRSQEKELLTTENGVVEMDVDFFDIE